MAYYSYEGCGEMAIDYYNANTGVTSRLATGYLLTFMLTGTVDSGRLKQANDNLNTSSSSISSTMCGSFYHRYFDEGDPGDWTYAKAELIRCSSLIRGTYLYDTYFKNGHIGDKIIWYNKDNVAYKLSIEYRGPQTDSGYTYYTARMRLEVPGLATYYTGNFAIAGVDGYNRQREFAWGFVADRANGYACPYYLTFTFNWDSESGTYGKDGEAGVTNLYGYINANKNQYNSTYRYFMYGIFAGETPQPPVPSDDPYAPGGTSETQEPNGSYDDTSDTISVPSTPALNLALSNFMSAYSPNITKINELANFIWGDYSGLDRHIAKFFADPTDAIISLHMVPFTPSTSSDVEVTVGKYGTGISMPPITTQFKDVDCGSLTIEPYWDNYLDYNPYTRLTLVLPYVGEVQLDPDEVMGQTVNVLYRVDVLSGAFVCFVSTATKILAQYTGCCILTVPISSASYAAANAAIMRLAVSAVGLGAGAVGYSAAMEGGVAKEIKQAKAGLMDAAGNAGSSAMSVVNAKVNHSHSGSIAGTAGFLGRQKPYLLIHRARQSVPEDANRYYGYPCNVTIKLEDLTGFTKIKNIVMDDLPFTRGEIEDLRAILAAGVYL